MIDMFRQVFDAMTPDQQSQLSWIAVEGERYVGEMQQDDILRLAAACIDKLAKSRSENYKEYCEEVAAICQGLAQGFIQGGEDFYLQQTYGL